MAGWTVSTVSGTLRRAASCMAHSRARREWPDPSTPTMIPGISVLLTVRAPCFTVTFDARSAMPSAAGPSGRSGRDFGPLPQRLAGRVDHRGMTVPVDAHHAVQADPATRLDAGDLGAAVEYGGQLAGRVGHLTGQHVVPRNGPDLRRAPAARSAERRGG